MREVRITLVGEEGELVGALPPFEVAMPWWQEVSDVVAGARARFGVDLSVLRLVRADRPAPPGGVVSYLAQLVEPPADASVAPGGARASVASPRPIGVDGIGPGELAPHPARAPWAEPGGPGRSLRWAADTLDRLGRGPFVATQQRAWNLSAIWRLDPAGQDGQDGRDGAVPGGRDGAVWLKQVPGFFRHEAAVLRWLGEVAPGAAPTLIAADGPTGAGRMLLEHVPGEDRYGADLAERHAIAADHHRIQLTAAARVGELVARGVPDGRGSALARTVLDELTRHGADLAGVRHLLDELPERMAAVAGCGLPDTLVHGDLHPGNVRSDGHRRVIIDWGDAFVGHPAFDILRFTEDLPDADAADLLRRWRDRWRRDRPGCDPDRAVALLRPVAALRYAAVYAAFLARIEPSEHPFHAGDVDAYLRRAAGYPAGH
nr:aminoglycoside phosphotransferase family protein [Micromonospora sp. DSM 115978]